MSIGYASGVGQCRFALGRLAGPHLGIGAARAEQFATAHENSGPSAIPFDNQMDLHNNSTGRALGTPGADCRALCRTAVTSGTLRTVRGPATVPPGPVAAPCLGASDQPWP